jgi:hypothetical protein
LTYSNGKSIKILPSSLLQYGALAPLPVATLFILFFLPGVSALRPFSIVAALLLIVLSGLPGIQSRSVHDHVLQDLFDW